MKGYFLKAQAKKKKFIKRLQKIKRYDDSDGELSSDDEQEISNNFVGKLINEKYIVIKYLSRGTFSKVWLVYDLIANEYYALKIQDDEDNEPLLNEIKMLNFIQKNSKNSNICYLVDFFDVKIDGVNKKALLLELLGDSIEKLLYEENDGIISLDLIKKISRSILNGINGLHQNNLIHCDLKLDNILFSEKTKNIKNIIDKVNKLDLHNNYNTILQNTLNNKLVNLTKSKRKTMKKKIKKRVIKEILKENIAKILEIGDCNSIDLNNVEEINIEELKNESENKNKYEIDINLENINAKILDLGNTEFLNNNNTEEIYTRCYRPPENIIDGSFTTKSDIWALGCIIYELIIGNSIFNFDDCNKVDIDKDRYHLSQMYSLLGKMNKDLSLNCEYSDDYFDLKGRILKYRNIEMRDIKDELTNRIEMTDEELELTLDFIFKMLDYNPINRYSAEELLNHKWLEDNENLNLEIL